MAIAMVIAMAGTLAACTTAPVRSVPVVAAVSAVSAVSDAKLLGIEWTAAAIDGLRAVAQPRPTLRWTSPQQLVGSGGCNQFRARVVMGPDSLRIGPIAGFGTACLTTPSGQEDLFFKALESTQKAYIQGTQLVMTDGAGKVLLRLDSAGAPSK
jgi:heat shock protein HslJ